VDAVGLLQDRRYPDGWQANTHDVMPMASRKDEQRQMMRDISQAERACERRSRGAA